MPLELAEHDRPFMDARRMTNVGLILKGDKKAKRTGKPKPQKRQNLVTSAARTAAMLHNARRQRYLAEINQSINLLGAVNK